MINQNENVRRTDHYNNLKNSATEKLNVRDSHTIATMGNGASGSRKSNATRQSELETDSVNSSFDDSGLFNDTTLKKYQITQTIYQHWTRLTIKALIANLVFSIGWLLIDVLLFRIDNPYTGKYNFHGLINGALIFIQAVVGLCICYSIDNSSVIDRPGLERRLSNIAIFFRIVFLVVIILEIFVVILVLTKGNDYKISSTLFEHTSPIEEV